MIHTIDGAGAYSFDNRLFLGEGPPRKDGPNVALSDGYEEYLFPEPLKNLPGQKKLRQRYVFINPEGEIVINGKDIT